MLVRICARLLEPSQEKAKAVKQKTGVIFYSIYSVRTRLEIISELFAMTPN
jgi:hypothetical protein